MISLHRLMDLRAALIGPSDYGKFRAFPEAVDDQDRLGLSGTVR